MVCRLATHYCIYSKTVGKIEVINRIFLCFKNNAKPAHCLRMAMILCCREMNDQEFCVYLDLFVRHKLSAPCLENYLVIQKRSQKHGNNQGKKGKSK